MIAGVVRKKPMVVLMQTRYGNRRRDEHAEEYGNVACQREGHRAKYDTRHKHRDNNANGTKNTGQHHVVQLCFSS